MVDWRVLSTDLRSGEVGPDVRLTSGRWTETLGRAAEFEGALKLRRCPPSLIEGGRLVLHLEVGGLLGPNAIVWDPRPNRDGDTATVDLRGQSLESYWDRRRLRTDLNLVQVDEANMVAQLVDLTEQGDGIGVDTSQVTPTGTLRDRTTDWDPDDRPYIGHLIRLLTEVVDGPSVRIATPRPDPTAAPDRVLEVRAADAGAEIPGALRLGDAIRGYDCPILGSQQANHWEVLGIGEGADMVVGQAVDPSTLDRWPQLDGVDARKSVSQQETVDGHAAAHLQRSALPPVALTLTLDPDKRPRPSAWRLGDILDVQLVDPPFRVVMPMRAVRRTWTINGDSLDVSVLCNPTTTDRPALTVTPTVTAPEVREVVISTTPATIATTGDGFGASPPATSEEVIITAAPE